MNIKINDKRRKNYFEIDNDYVKLYARYLGTTATAVYTSLCMHSDYYTQICWPSMETIGEQHGIDRHTVSKALAKLEEWNIISAERAIDRKNKKRKNNVYKLISKELWKKLPILEINHGVNNPIDSHGLKSTTTMVQNAPQDGNKDTSNNPHIIKPSEQNTNCGQEPTMSIVPTIDNENAGENHGETKMVAIENQPVVWNTRNAIKKLLESGQKDYIIIGGYFYTKKWSFDNEIAFEAAVKRELKPANILKEYKLKNIKMAMKWCEDAYGQTTGWTLETVIKRISDGITNGFLRFDLRGRSQPRAEIGKYDKFISTTIKI